MLSPPSRSRRLIGLQIALIVAMLMALAFMPPAQGRMLLIPLGTTDAKALAPRAVATGAALIDSGPFAGSIVVDGKRADLARTIGRVLIVAAPQSGCGQAIPLA